ncbi:MAG: alpha/beta hydrolase, partial [Gammaproteobacteria bacterium]
PPHWLIVQGDEDEIVPCEAVVDWVNSLDPGAQLVVMPGAGHFFHGALVPLRQQIVQFMSEAL